MASVILGQTARVDIPVTDGASPPTGLDPSAITATVTDQITGTQITTGSLAGGQIVRLGLGSFRYLIDTGSGAPVPAAGSYAIDVATTNPRGRMLDWLDVVAPVPPLINLAAAKQQTGKSSTADDAEVRFFVDAVNARMEEECGAIVPRQVTELGVVADRRGRLFVKQRPILRLVSATQNGVSIPVTTWAVPEEGPISLPTSPFIAGPPATSLLLGTYDLVYVAGRAPVPATLPLAARMLFQDWWKTQRSTTSLQPIGTDDQAGAYLAAVAAGRAFPLPPRIEGMIATYREGLTFA